MFAAKYFVISIRTKEKPPDAIGLKTVHISELIQSFIEQVRKALFALRKLQNVLL